MCVLVLEIKIKPEQVNEARQAASQQIKVFPQTLWNFIIEPSWPEMSHIG